MRGNMPMDLRHNLKEAAVQSFLEGMGIEIVSTLCRPTYAAQKDDGAPLFSTWQSEVPPRPSSKRPIFGPAL